MATIKIRRSTTASAVPTSLVTGEVAINEADGILYYRNSGGTVSPLTPPQNSLTYGSQTTAQMVGRTVLVNTNSGAVTIALSPTNLSFGASILFVNTGGNTLTLQHSTGPTYLTKAVPLQSLCLAVYVAAGNVWFFLT